MEKVYLRYFKGLGIPYSKDLLKRYQQLLQNVANYERSDMEVFLAEYGTEFYELSYLFQKEILASCFGKNDRPINADLSVLLHYYSVYFYPAFQSKQHMYEIRDDLFLVLNAGKADRSIDVPATSIMGYIGSQMYKTVISVFTEWIFRNRSRRAKDKRIEKAFKVSCIKEMEKLPVLDDKEAAEPIWVSYNQLNRLIKTFPKDFSDTNSEVMNGLWSLIVSHSSYGIPFAQCYTDFLPNTVCVIQEGEINFDDPVSYGIAQVSIITDRQVYKDANLTQDKLLSAFKGVVSDLRAAQIYIDKYGELSYVLSDTKALRNILGEERYEYLQFHLIKMLATLVVPAHKLESSFPEYFQRKAVSVASVKTESKKTDTVQFRVDIFRNHNFPNITDDEPNIHYTEGESTGRSNKYAFPYFLRLLPEHFNPSERAKKLAEDNDVSLGFAIVYEGKRIDSWKLKELSDDLNCTEGELIEYLLDTGGILRSYTFVYVKGVLKRQPRYIRLSTSKDISLNGMSFFLSFYQNKSFKIFLP